MAINLLDLADKLNVKVADIRDYIDLLDLDVPKNALDVSEEKAKILEEEIKKDIEAKEVPVKDEVEISKESISKVEQYEAAIEEAMQREIKDSQRKKTAGKKDTKKKKKKEEPKKLGEEIKDVGVEEAAKRTATGVIEIPDAMTVNEFAQRSGIPVARVIGELMKNGVLATINQRIDYDTAAIIAHTFEIKIAKKQMETSVEQLMGGDLEVLLKNEDPQLLQERPPVVVVMGHVDHGKTRILDKIRSTDVMSGEAGGITQHIGAYQITHKGKRITFLDTPGHASFSAMRARGARVTDIALLVVAADEGVKTQTEEAYQHAKTAEVPLIAVINKIDKEGSDPERVKTELSQKLGISLEGWGGDVPVCLVSAETGEGIENLLDHILLLAEVNQYKANPNRQAIGTVIESHLDKNLGPIATVIINTGTLQLMDPVVIGSVFGKMKRMMDHKGKTLNAVGPSGPVQIAGLSAVPPVGDLLIAMKDEKTARQRASKIAALRKTTVLQSTLSELMTRIKEGKLKVLKLMVKADTKGSLEAIQSSLQKSGTSEVAVQVIYGGIGNVTMNDINMAATSMAVIFTFHVSVPPEVRKLAEQLRVEIRETKIIYQLLEDVRQILEGLLDPEIVEVELGEAKVLQIFLAKRNEMIVGCKIQKGKIPNKGKVRILRAGQIIGEGEITGLQREKEKVNEVLEGFECGIRVLAKFPLQEEDVISAYAMEKRKRFFA